MNSISSSSSAPTRGLSHQQKSDYLQKLAQFFFFVTLDEELAGLFSRRAAGEFLRRSADEVSDKALVQVCYFALKKLWDEKQIHRSFTVSYKKGWSFPEPMDLSPWASFRAQAEVDELAAVLFVKVLKIPKISVVEALGISPGTVQLRLSRGLRQLGAQFAKASG